MNECMNEWNGVEWNGKEWNGDQIEMDVEIEMGWNGMEWMRG